MSTTTLFVELIIIGLEVCLWLILGVNLIVGNSGWFANLTSKFGNNAVLATIIVLATAYLFGIVIDKIAHFLIGYERLDQLLQPKHYKDGSHLESLANWLRAWLEAKKIERKDHPRMIHARSLIRSGEMGGDILYARSKIRILRASVFNVPLITLLAAGQLCCHNRQYLLVLAIGVVLTGLVIFAYLYTQRLYNRRLRRFAEFLGEKKLVEGGK